MLFVSYSSTDEPVVTELCACLLDASVPVWVDKRRISVADSIPRRIEQALDKANRMLVVWSKNSSKSAHVRNEFEAFYFKHPHPDAILFFRIDQTNVPTLYAARRYLDTTSNLRHDAQSIVDWAKGRESPGISVADCAPPETAELQTLPPGPMVELHRIPEQLVRAYAKALSDRPLAEAVISRANRRREECEPPGAGGILIDLGLLPAIEHAGAYPYWHKAFQQAFLHGPRMVAALLWSQSDELFPEQARQERASLLRHLRSLAQCDKHSGIDSE
jgi:hypothetical protein